MPSYDQSLNWSTSRQVLREGFRLFIDSWGINRVKSKYSENITNLCQPYLLELGFRPRTVREALDKGWFVGLPFKYLSGRIRVAPKSGPFKGEMVTLWDILEEKSRSEKKLSVTSKSWAGDVVEGVFGVPKNSSSSKDLGFLELKTFGIAAKGAGEIPKTMEANLKLSTFSWQSVNDMDFNSSSLHQKILQQLWVPLLTPPRSVDQDNEEALEWMGQFTC